MSVCERNECRFLQRPEEDFVSPGVRVTDYSETPDMGAGTKLQSSTRAVCTKTTEPFLLPLESFYGSGLL